MFSMLGKRDEDTVVEQSPKGEINSNGAAKQSNKGIEGMIRTLKSTVGQTCSCSGWLPKVPTGSRHTRG